MKNSITSLAAILAAMTLLPGVTNAQDPITATEPIAVESIRVTPDGRFVAIMPETAQSQLRPIQRPAQQAPQQPIAQPRWIPCRVQYRTPLRNLIFGRYRLMPVQGGQR